jgi:hypothetical protein
MTIIRKPTSRRPWRSSLLALATLASGAAAQDYVVRPVTPSAADPGVRRFDDPSLAIATKGLAPDAPLALFLTGTGGKPANAPVLLRTIADQGYRVLALEYDDEPAVVQVCPRDPDPACSAKFRQMRIDGGGPGVGGVTNPPAEGIVARLVAALRALDASAPGEGWGGYLDGGQPRWDRIVVSGLSQGAGMAAFLAKAHLVRRVVLFSSPWDFTGPERRLAPWIAGPSATPPERWWAEYNKRENTADLLARSYVALGIPADHVLVFDRPIPPNLHPTGPNPYHPITIRDPGYAPQWRVLYGAP